MPMPPRRARLTVGCCCLSAGLLILAAGCRSETGRSLSDVMEEVRARFPAVEQVSTDDLARELASPESPRPVLVDVRSEAEYAVSHLRGAERAETVGEVEALVHGDKNASLVLYCSVGYRSSQLASALLGAGFHHVRNLEGSIFKWANEGKPVYRDGHPVRAVHPYNDDWGRLLDRELWQR